MTRPLSRIVLFLLPLWGTGAVLAQGLEVRAERPLTELSFEAAAGMQMQPDVATDGLGFAVVWADSRFADVNFPGLRVARVSANGEILDPVGIPVPGSRGGFHRIHIFWTGSEYLIVWVSGAYDIWAIRFSLDGSFVDAAPRWISGGPSGGTPAIAWNGTNLLIARVGVSVVLVSAHLEIVRSNIQLPTGSQKRLSTIPAAGSNGREFLIVFGGPADGGQVDLFGVRIDETGDVLDPSAFRIASFSRMNAEIVVGSNGRDYLLAWPDIAGVFGAIVPATGAPSAPAFLLHRASAVGDLVWTGSRYLVPVWSHLENYGPKDLFLVPVSATTGVMQPLVISDAPQSQVHGALAWTGRRALVVWTDTRRTTADVFGAFVDEGGKWLPLPTGGREFVLSFSPPAQRQPAVASDGEIFLAVWSQSSALRGEAAFARFTSRGDRLDGAGTRLPASPLSQTGPAVTFNGRDFVLIWREEAQASQTGHSAPGRLVGARVDRQGRVLDEHPFVIFDKVAGGYSIASDGTDVLVAFEKADQERSEIGLAKITRDGDPFLVAAVKPRAAFAASPSIAFGRGAYLVVWNEHRVINQVCQILCPVITETDVWGLRLAPTGSILDAPFAVAIDPEESEVNPQVAWGGEAFLVVWGEYSGHARRVRHDGVVLDGAPGDPGILLMPKGWLPNFRLAYDGLTFVVTGGSSTSYNAGEVTAMRIAKSGRPLDQPNGFVVAAPVAFSPALAAGARGETAVVYARNIADPLVGVDRLFTTTIRQRDIERRRPVR